MKKLGATLFLGSLLLAALPGCPASEQSAALTLSGSCNLQPDQKGSFMPKAVETPFTVIADSSFTETQRTSITNAVTEWNALAQRLSGQDFFQLKYDVVPDTVRGMDPRDCSQNSGPDNVFYIVREQKMDHWRSLGFSEHIPGATIRCTSDQQLTHQIIMVNTEITDPLQLTSVFVHEFGHSIGLDHSCVEGKGKPEYRGCADLALSHPYHVAVMYPALRVRASASDLPELKESLRTNDVERAQCLYSKSSAAETGQP